MSDDILRMVIPNQDLTLDGKNLCVFNTKALVKWMWYSNEIQLKLCCVYRNIYFYKRFTNRQHNNNSI